MLPIGVVAEQVVRRQIGDDALEPRVESLVWTIAMPSVSAASARSDSSRALQTLPDPRSAAVGGGGARARLELHDRLVEGDQAARIDGIEGALPRFASSTDVAELLSLSICARRIRSVSHAACVGRPGPPVAFPVVRRPVRGSMPTGGSPLGAWHPTARLSAWSGRNSRQPLLEHENGLALFTHATQVADEILQARRA